MNWMEIQTLSLRFIASCAKVPFYILVEVRHLVMGERICAWEGTKLVQYVSVCCIRVFERMDVALYNGSERGIFEQLICFAGVSEYTDRYYLICV